MEDGSVHDRRKESSKATSYKSASGDEHLVRVIREPGTADCSVGTREKGKSAWGSSIPRDGTEGTGAPYTARLSSMKESSLRVQIVGTLLAKR